LPTVIHNIRKGTANNVAVGFPLTRWRWLSS